MKFDHFVEALHEAGWRSPCDAQHTEIKKLHAKLFPVVAQLEDELQDMVETCDRLHSDFQRIDHKLCQLQLELEKNAAKTKQPGDPA